MKFQEWLEAEHADPKSTVWKSNAGALQAAYAAGREAMREEAAKLCHDYNVQHNALKGYTLVEFDHECEGLHTGMAYAKAIRSIK